MIKAETVAPEKEEVYTLTLSLREVIALTVLLGRRIAKADTELCHIYRDMYRSIILEDNIRASSLYPIYNNQLTNWSSNPKKV